MGKKKDKKDKQHKQQVAVVENTGEPKSKLKAQRV